MKVLMRTMTRHVWWARGWRSSGSTYVSAYQPGPPSPLSYHAVLCCCFTVVLLSCRWYLGTIQSYDEATQKHKILFERGVRDINLPVHGDSNHAFKFVKPTTELRVPENPPYSEQEASWKVIVKGVAPRTLGEAPPVEEGKEGEPEGHGV